MEKYCEFCKKKIEEEKWVKHQYSKVHRINFRTINTKPLQIDKKDYNIQTVKLELLELAEDLKNIINKISTIV
jgi:hypothetical protein